MANRDASADAQRRTTSRPEPSGADIALQLATTGSGGLAILGAILVARAPAWTLSSADAIFWGSVATLAAVRFAMLRRSRRGPGQPDTGKSVSGWIKFALILGAIAAVVWLAGHAVQLRPR